MSYPDYEQTTHDHAALLVLLKPLGTDLKQKTITKLYDRIVKSCNKLNITDSNGVNRNVYFRFVKDYPVENNDWGDFQTHRRLLGLITFGKYSNQLELNELCRLHETLKVKYHPTLYDSRAILFGPVESENLNEPPKDFTTPSNFKTTGAFYSDETCPTLENEMMECLQLLFWILESKRLKQTREKIDKIPLRAPFEKKELIGLDLESRNNKKRCTGRMTKHLADLCLQAGLYADALNYYHSAGNSLQSVNDWLWLGAAFEGLCATSALVLYPNLRKITTLHRNSSLQETSPKQIQRRDSRTNNFNINNDNDANKTIEKLRLELSNLLTVDDIPKKYRECIVHYSKYKNASIIETEASFKAAQISIEQNCSLQASCFLNNVVFNYSNISEDEKILRFTKLSQLYSSFGFHRKSSFYLRLAALRFVSAQNKNQDWKQCYSLLLQSINGYKLSLDPLEMTNDNRKGWPTIQIKLLNELITAANNMGNFSLAIRHLTFLLQTLYDYLNKHQRKDLALQLSSLTKRKSCDEGNENETSTFTNSPLVLDNGLIIPPANLTNIPKTKSFVLKNLQPYLQPLKIQVVKEDHGPFLFTPINFGSLDRKIVSSNKNSNKNKLNFLWVEGDVCEVTIQLINELPFELNVNNMELLTSGILFESIPESITLPGDSGPIGVTLAGKPRENGVLQIHGFSTETLGVKSNCKLKYLSNINVKSPYYYCINVVPGLPKISVSTSLPQTASFINDGENIVTSASLSLYGGESAECTITIQNVGTIPIDMIDISIKSTLDAIIQSKLFQWSDDNIQTQLPLLPGSSASLTLYLYANYDFIVKNKYHFHSNIVKDNNNIFNSKSKLSNDPKKTSIFKVSSTINNVNSVIVNNNNNKLSKLSVPLVASNTVEGQLKIKYSGNGGFSAGYCRISTVYINIEILPSINITNWDVLPAEISSQFYLVLDVSNMTNQEMELYYTQNKCIFMAGKESCRIPVPVDRCPLSKLDYENHQQLQSICAQHISSLVDLKWQLLGTDLSGKATLSGISFTRDMLDLVRMSPLQWEVVINDTAVKPQDEITCNVGEGVTIGIGVCNALERPLKNLLLSIDFYQDYQNGTYNYKLDSRLCIAGINKVTLPTLREYERAYHECCVVFFHTGQFKLDIKCTDDNSSNSSSDFGHIWRYIPSIEINVEDNESF